MLNPERLVPEQLDGYHARDLARFVACYADDVQLFSPPAAEPAMLGKAALSAHYAAKRFNLPQLHAELVNRMVLGNKVVDHERISGVRAEPFDAGVVFEVKFEAEFGVNSALISKVWFFSADRSAPANPATRHAESTAAARTPPTRHRPA